MTSSLGACSRVVALWSCDGALHCLKLLVGELGRAAFRFTMHGECAGWCTVGELHGFVAQWIERLSPEQKVVGSTPIKPTF